MTGGPGELTEIPGVGPAVRADLEALGIRRIADLRGRDPESLYRELGEVRGGPIDRCMLYVFRCAVYYASTPRPIPEKLKWWAWKDAGDPRRGGP